MINISKPIACVCRQLPKKYTIHTLSYLKITDYQHNYNLQYKFTRFPIVKKERRVNAFSLCLPTLPHNP